MAKKSIFKVSLSGDGPYGAFIEKEISWSVVAKFKKWMNKGFGYSYQAPIADASEPILTMNSAMSALSSKEFQDRAKEVFKNRLVREQKKKFTTGGYRTWAPLSPKTLRLRNYLAYVWNINPKSEKTPLLFSGTLADVVTKGLEVNKFSFFSKREWGKGYFKISDLNIIVGWKDPKIPAPWWYFHKTKNAIRKFGDLIEYHRIHGRKAFISGGKEKMTERGEIVETKELTKGEFFRNVWSPFLKNDLPKVFKVKENDKKVAVKTTQSLLETIMRLLNMTEDAKKRVYEMIEKKEVSEKVATQTLKELLKKEFRGEE